MSSAAEFIRYAKESKTPLSYSSVGHGANQHLVMEYLKQRFGLDMTHVPYRNTGQAVTDIVAGHVDAGFVEAGVSLPLIKEGKHKALAVSASTPLPLLPEVPPLSAATDIKDFEAVGWHVLFAPAQTPDAIVQRLHSDMKDIMSSADMRNRTAAIGLIPHDTPSPAGIRDFMRSEYNKWGDLVRSLGLQGTQ